ncbi:MAG: hypothetical protein C6W57_12540 [Caldibacillus debilis]|nr:MAG: hypothetical protein C6W57_12540 [Caldibacillus debilis]
MDVSILTNRKEGLKSFRRRRLSDCRKKGAEGNAGRGEWGRGRDGAIGQSLWGIPKAKKISAKSAPLTLNGQEEPEGRKERTEKAKEVPVPEGKTDVF